MIKPVITWEMKCHLLCIIPQNRWFGGENRPIPGVYYTIARPDLEVFEITKVKPVSIRADRQVWYVEAVCHMPDGQKVKHKFDDFMGMEFHTQRIMLGSGMLDWMHRTQIGEGK